MDTNLSQIGYQFEASKYSPGLGYSRLRSVISGRPTQRFFDTKALHIPTFDGRFYHPTQITRHELSPQETFQVCLGPIKLDNHQGESLRAFSFGGVLKATIQGDDLYCDMTSTAPIFRLQEDPNLAGSIVADELMELIAEIEVHLKGQEDELYSRLAKFDPYQLFLASLVSLQKRVDSIPTHMRRGKYLQVVTAIRKAFQIVQTTDGWDGHSPSLEELLSSGGS